MESGEHKLLLTGRKSLEVSGVLSVDSFDNERIELSTDLGGLLIEGEELKVGTLNLNQGQVAVSGVINGIGYGKSREEKSARYRGKSFVSRLLK